MTTATFLWEGDDDEPALLIRLEGEGQGPVEAEVREALEAEVPRFQDLIAVETGLVRGKAGWTSHWLLLSRSQEERLHQYPQGWDLLAGALAPLVQGTVVVAPETSSAWTVVVKDQGRITSVRRLPPEQLTSLSAPYLVVLPDSAPGRSEIWRGTGLPARVLPRAAVISAPVKSRLVRQLDQAAGQDFAVLRLEAPRSTGVLAVAALLALLVAVNLLLLGDPPQVAPELMAASALAVPRPSSALYDLASAVSGAELKEFRMTGSSWRLDLRAASGVEALEALKKKAPGLRVLQFQAVSGKTRLVVEGEGYP